MFFIFYSILNNQNISINNSEKKVSYLLTGTSPAQLKKLQKLHIKTSNDWPMVSFIHNGSELATWIGYSFKIKSTKSKAKQHFKDNNIFF